MTGSKNLSRNTSQMTSSFWVSMLKASELLCKNSLSWCTSVESVPNVLYIPQSELVRSILILQVQPLPFLPTGLLNHELSSQCSPPAKFQISFLVLPWLLDRIRADLLGRLSDLVRSLWGRDESLIALAEEPSFCRFDGGYTSLVTLPFASMDLCC
ncbi:hypothetical protein BD289DRAFT_438580 [Coniella lustricola]|uniref:Uncharacterized protein n=1 Tax=Coniella lustricola TaxID=2025994 RepID=A0A2T3A2W5_9PEZI|nr:hypothetical protein BD289DRAFT_438580 [Coniella lustricola]